MTKNNKTSFLTLFVLFAVLVPAPASELDELKATIQSMQKSMEQMQAKIADLERENHKQKHHPPDSKTGPAAAAEPAVATEGAASAPASDQAVTIAPTAVTIEGRASEIKDRPAMDDQHEAAPRPNDLTL